MIKQGIQEKRIKLQISIANNFKGTEMSVYHKLTATHFM